MFPSKEYDDLKVKSLFGKMEITDQDLQELQKKVFNYPSLKVLNTINDEEIKKILLSYVSFLSKTYLGQSPQTYDERANNLLFNYNQWNIFVKYLLNDEAFLKDFFISLYNNFIDFQFNKSFDIITINYNNYINRINRIYEKNKFENGQIFIEPLAVNKFSDDLQKIYQKDKRDREISHMNHILITDKIPIFIENTQVILIE